MIERLLYFAGGFALGGTLFYFVGKRARSQNPDNEEAANSPDTTGKIVVESIDDEHYDEDHFDREEVIEVAKKEGYIPTYVMENDLVYDDIDLDNELEEMDDYLAETEHPTDDDSETQRVLYVIDADEYYTERHEYDKIKLFLENGADGSLLLVDALGNKYNSMFDPEYPIEVLPSMISRNSSDGSIYFRNDKHHSDFEVMFDGGDDD